jgi:hypothetical protein
MPSCCEHDNEPSGSIKCGEFLNQLGVLVASEECCAIWSWLVSWI